MIKKSENLLNIEIDRRTSKLVKSNDTSAYLKTVIFKNMMETVPFCRFNVVNITLIVNSYGINVFFITFLVGLAQ